MIKKIKKNKYFFLFGIRFKNINGISPDKFVNIISKGKLVKSF